MIRRSWKKTSSRSAETRRDKRQLAQHIAQAQSDALRCNHNTLVGLHWWTGRTANTPRKTPALVNFNLETEKTSQRDEPEMTSPRGSPKKGVGWTHHWRLNWNKRTFRKRRASETWTTHQSWYTWLNKNEQQKVLDELTMDASTSSEQSSKQTKKQTRIWPKRLSREIPSDEKLDQQQSGIWLVEPWPLWTNKKTSQRHDTSCNRPPQSRQNESNDPLVLTAKNMFSLRFPCTSTNNNWQTLCCTCHSHTEKTAQREETKKISSRHSATYPVTQHTDQQTSQTNQKHESNIWYWDMASGPDLCENNLDARTWAHQLLQPWTSQTTQHKNSNTHEQTIWILQITHDPS